MAGLVLGGVLVAGTNGIVIAAGVTDSVTLRNLEIDGVGTGLDGVKVTSAGNVHLENLRIFQFTGSSSNLNPSLNTQAFIKDVSIIGSAMGVTIDAASSTASAIIDNLDVRSNTSGLVALNGAQVTAQRSDFSGNTTGVSATGTSTAVTLDSGNIAYCTTAISVGAGAAVRIINMTITDNVTGLAASPGGAITSFVNNRIFGNGANGVPT